MSYQYPDSVILIFCKAPVPGQVKTRLLPTYSAKQAADIHRFLSADTIQRACKTQLCAVQLWCAPSTDFPFFKYYENKYQLSLYAQSGADLGERMDNAFRAVFSQYQHAILIGCDCPGLNEQDFAAALTALKRHNDVVLSPAEDGGYALIGLNNPQPELFTRIPWGTSKVLCLTRSRVKQLNLKCLELRTHWDVDTPADVEKLNLQATAFLFPNN